VNVTLSGKTSIETNGLKTVSDIAAMQVAALKANAEKAVSQLSPKEQEQLASYLQAFVVEHSKASEKLISEEPIRTKNEGTRFRCWVRLPHEVTQESKVGKALSAVVTYNLVKAGFTPNEHQYYYTDMARIMESGSEGKTTNSLWVDARIYS
jgi:hypothetical protein